jgi:hypothetical protein
MSSIKERLAAAKLPERSLQVCLRGDLAAEFDDLERQLKDARQDGTRRLAAKSESAEIVEKMAALQDQMRAELVTLRIRALPRSEWQALVRQHPPRDGEEADKILGANLTALMEEAIPRCVVEPEMDTDDWATFNDVLSSGDYDRLLNVVFDVNRSGADIPKSRLASLVMTESDAGSR